MPQFVSARALLRAGTLAAAFAVALPALAQQPAAPLPKPGTPGAPNQPLYGRPDNEAAMKLAPVPAPQAIMAADHARDGLTTALGVPGCPAGARRGMR